MILSLSEASRVGLISASHVLQSRQLRPQRHVGGQRLGKGLGRVLS
jgi:hypothetical protein